MKPSAMKCAFCAFTVPKWRTNKHGARISGYSRLSDHVHEAHPDEWDRIYNTPDLIAMNQAYVEGMKR